MTYVGGVLRFSVVVAVFLAAGATRAADDDGPGGAALVLFVQGGEHHADGQARALLDEYRGVSDRAGASFELREIDADSPVPSEILYTPALVYQNHLGRSVYVGRYTAIPRVENFVRTARYIAQEQATMTRANLPVSSPGRLNVATPIKVTALGGERPAGFDDEGFASGVGEALARGMESFMLAESIDLRRSDRMFYLDVHPYLADGVLFVSCEVYSQFNCHEPVYSGLGDPFIDQWERREGLFRDVGEALAEEVQWQIATSSGGDALTPIPAAQPVGTWAQIGLALPPAPLDTTVNQTAISTHLPQQWVIELDEADSSRVLFHFAPPLDSYAGEARALTGRLHIHSDDLQNSSATFEVPIDSLTMGEPLLDQTIRSAAYLGAASHPISTFTMRTIERVGDRGAGDSSVGLMYGQTLQCIMQGDFRLKGLTTPAAVRMTLEPILNEAGEPRLSLTADWNIRLSDPFGIPGPDGPTPANDTVLFAAHLILHPAPLGASTESGDPGTRSPTNDTSKEQEP